jgi:steroid delta-isomerase-like uncharacterized protein
MADPHIHSEELQQARRRVTMSNDVLRRAEKALVDMDADALVSLYAEDFVFEDTAAGDRITDKERLKDYFERLFQMPDVSFSDVEFFNLGESGAGRWTCSGNSLKSGQPYSIRGASLFRLQGDRIKEEILFYDPRAAVV